MSNYYWRTKDGLRLFLPVQGVGGFEEYKREYDVLGTAYWRYITYREYLLGNMESLERISRPFAEYIQVSK